MNRYSVSALFESLVCRWIAWPITTSTMVPKRALSQNGMRMRGFTAGPRSSTEPPGCSIEDVAVGMAPDRGSRSRCAFDIGVSLPTGYWEHDEARGRDGGEFGDRAGDGAAARRAGLAGDRGRAA